MEKKNEIYFNSKGEKYINFTIKLIENQPVNIDDTTLLFKDGIVKVFSIKEKGE